MKKTLVINLLIRCDRKKLMHFDILDEMIDACVHGIEFAIIRKDRRGICTNYKHEMELTKRDYNNKKLMI